MIEGYIKKGDSTASELEGDSEEYELIVNSNTLTIEIDNELLIIHKVCSVPSPRPTSPDTDSMYHQFIKDHYLPRFPELDSLVPLPLPFCRVLLALGNGSDLRGDITGLLTSGAIMAVKVTAATTKGVVLEEKEWDIVKEAVGIMFSLEESKNLVRTPCIPQCTTGEDSTTELMSV